jgi:hypothetical protein
MIERRAGLLLVVLAALSIGCDSDEGSKSKGDEAAKKTAEDTKAQAKDEAKGSDDKDRGTATVTIGGTKWTAESCRARPKKDTLKISCSTVDMNDGKVDRQAIDFVLPKYSGAGDYKAAPGMSNFTGVGFDGKKAAAEENADKAAKDAVVAGVQGATIIMLGGMDVKVTNADGGFVDGTFSKAADEVMKKPAFEDGTFHARLVEEKK